MIRVGICGGMECSARGGQELIDAIENDPLLSARVQLVFERCSDLCEAGERSPVVFIDGIAHVSMSADKLSEILLGLLDQSLGQKGA